MRRVGPFETDACFGFHHVNAYEEGDEVVVDICAFDDAGIVEDLYLERLRAGKPVADPELRALPDPPGDGSGRATSAWSRTASTCRGSTTARCNERPYRYVWGVGIDDSGWLDADRQGRRRAPRDHRLGGARLLPRRAGVRRRPGGEDEDEGVLLSVVLDAERGASFLLVLDAAHLDELARAEVPHHIPFGFHGQFAPAR